jgi:penicillin amidase
VDDMMALQTDTRDFLASEITPILLDALSTGGLSPGEQQASLLLARWDYRMEVDSTAATVWSTFWQSYLAATFDGVWKAKGVTVDRGEVEDALGQDLEAWTLNDHANPGFSVGGTTRTAGDVMRIAFRDAVSKLTKQLGSDPNKWTWGRVHFRVIENLAQISGLDYGPRPERGDANTPLAAGGFPSTHGPSWRMVVDWGSKSFNGIYPGGQSENPASGWYDDRVDAWFEGRYSPMLTADQASASAGAISWSLQP